MPPVNFKLTRNDQTRRFGFSDLPTWDVLAGKLEAIYGISPGKVGISYIDNDNDEITASSNDELQDFYQTTHQIGQPIKFKVLDLSAIEETSGKPAQVNEAANTNTFGRDDLNFDFPESDWQRLGPFNVAEFVDALSEGPHAFVEIIDSDVSGFTKFPEETNQTSSEDAQSTVQPTYTDKGKRKASSSSLAAVSVTSVIDEDFTQKYPVHVAAHGSLKPQEVPPATEVASDDQKPPIFVESTPKTQRGNTIQEEEQPSAARANDIEDPPLPSIETSIPSYASANLSHDIATLLTNLTGIISSHPELSEGVRNIVRNATTGAYWQRHRAALSQAANELQQTGTQIEEEAARRVSEAIGNIFRTLSIAEEGNPTTSTSTTQTAPQQDNNPFKSSSAYQSNFRPTFPWIQPPFHARHSFPNRSSTGPDGWNFFPRPPWASGMMHHLPPGPPPPPGFPPHRASSFPPPPPPMHNMPFPPPPPPPLPPRQPPIVLISPTPVTKNVAKADPSPSVPSPGNVAFDPSSSQPFIENVYGGGNDADHSTDVPNANLRRSSVGPEGGSHSPSYQPGLDLSQRHQELRDRVEEAKRQYKAQKEAYRKEREERRKEKENRNKAHRDGEDRDKLYDFHSLIELDDFICVD